MKVLRAFLFVVVWLSLSAIILALLLLLCGSVKAAPSQAPEPPQAPELPQSPSSDFWVIAPPEGACGCAPGESCSCGHDCVCYGQKVKPKPNPKPIKRRVKLIVPCNSYVPVSAPVAPSAPTFYPSAPMFSPMMGGSMGGFGGGFGGGCGGGGCGGGG